MRTLIYFMAISVFFFTSCCGGGSENKSDKETAGEEVVVTEEVTESENGETEVIETEEVEINSCDEFLNKYEEWVDEYLNLLEKFRKNPTDPNLSQQYMKVSNELASWSQEWFKFIDCSNQKEYEKRYDAISEKIDEKMKELGYE